MPDDPDLRSAKPEPLPDRGWKLLDAGRAEEALAFGQALLGRRPSAAAYYLCGEALYRLRGLLAGK